MQEDFAGLFLVYVCYCIYFSKYCMMVCYAGGVSTLLTRFGAFVSRISQLLLSRIKCLFSWERK